MKKVFVSICIASTVLAMFSCRSVEKAVPLASINGEWNIIEVNGSKVTPGVSFGAGNIDACCEALAEKLGEKS